MPRRKSFSWKRTLGVTKAKRKFAKVTGIPTTKSGRKQKIKRMLTPGCVFPIITLLMLILTIVILT